MLLRPKIQATDSSPSDMDGYTLVQVETVVSEALDLLRTIPVNQLSENVKTAITLLFREACIYALSRENDSSSDEDVEMDMDKPLPTPGFSWERNDASCLYPTRLSNSTDTSGIVQVDSVSVLSASGEIGHETHDDEAAQERDGVRRDSSVTLHRVPTIQTKGHGRGKLRRKGAFYFKRPTQASMDTIAASSHSDTSQLSHLPSRSFSFCSRKSSTLSVTLPDTITVLSSYPATLRHSPSFKDQENDSLRSIVTTLSRALTASRRLDKDRPEAYSIPVGAANECQTPQRVASPDEMTTPSNRTSIHVPSNSPRWSHIQFISSGELHSFVYSMGYYLTEEETQRLMISMDLDDDTLISFDEFISWWKAESRVQFLVNLTEEQSILIQQLADDFRHFDLYDEGFLYKEQFEMLFLIENEWRKRLPPNMSQDEIFNIVSGRSHQSGDHRVYFNDFISWIVDVGAIPSSL